MGLKTISVGTVDHGNATIFLGKISCICGPTEGGETRIYLQGMEAPLRTFESHSDILFKIEKEENEED